MAEKKDRSEILNELSTKMYDLIDYMAEQKVEKKIKEKRIATISVATITNTYTYTDATTGLEFVYAVDLNLPNSTVDIYKRWYGGRAQSVSVGDEVYLVKIGDSIKQSFVINKK